MEHLEKRWKKLTAWIKRLELHIKPEPEFYSISATEIRKYLEYCEKRTPQQYQPQIDLFGDLPLHHQVYEMYQQYESQYKYRKTRIRHAAEDLGLSEKKAASLIRKHERIIESDNYWQIGKRLRDNGVDIERAIEIVRETEKHNVNIMDKISRTHSLRLQLSERIESWKMEQGQEAYVEIDFSNLEHTWPPGLICGGLSVRSYP